MGRIVSTGGLIEAVWIDDDIPADVTNALQSLVSRLRRALGSAASITQHEGGYRLAVERSDVDAHAFATAAREGHAAVAAGRHGQAVDVLSVALAGWRGTALQDADSAPYAVTARRRLDETRLDAIADRVDAQLVLGGGDGLVAELEALVAEHPLRERFTGQLMTALAAAGRSAEALAAYEQLRRFLADELGTDPSPGAQAVRCEPSVRSSSPTTQQRLKPCVRRRMSDRRSAASWAAGTNWTGSTSSSPTVGSPLWSGPGAPVRQSSPTRWPRPGSVASRAACGSSSSRRSPNPTGWPRPS